MPLSSAGKEGFHFVLQIPNTFILLVVTGYDVKGEKNDSYFRKEKSSFPNHLCETPHPGLREQATCCETYKKELAFSLSIFC